MEMLQTILVTVIALGVLVSVHEYGHFWVARRCGVRVLEFSLGFSLGVFRPLWSHVGKDGTRYVIHAVPLGGYVKMLDEREGPVEPQELKRTFNRAPVSRRIAIVSAGPLANFALAVLAYYALFMVGVDGVAPVIGSVKPGSAADAAGLEPGQEIVAVDGNRTTTQQQVEMRLASRLGETGEIRFAVRYPGSDITYESSARVQDWMRDAEQPDMTAALGLEYQMPKIEPKIGSVNPGSPAERAGIQAGDRVVAVDGESIESWDQWATRLRASPERHLMVQIDRAGETLTLDLVPERKTQEDASVIGFAGVGSAGLPPDFIRTERYGPIDAWRPAVTETWALAVFTVDSVGKMLVGAISPKNLSGPITIAKVAAASAKLGLKYYVNFIALLSIMLGVLNLLPIPVLDGGHLLFCLIEMVKGSPVSERVQMLGYQVGFAILVGVMILALFNDISRIAAN